MLVISLVSLLMMLPLGHVEKIASGAGEIPL
jgi:hypothetical protein